MNICEVLLHHDPIRVGVTSYLTYMDNYNLFLFLDNYYQEKQISPLWFFGDDYSPNNDKEYYSLKHEQLTYLIKNNFPNFPNGNISFVLRFMIIGEKGSGFKTNIKKAMVHQQQLLKHNGLITGFIFRICQTSNDPPTNIYDFKYTQSIKNQMFINNNPYHFIHTFLKNRLPKLAGQGEIYLLDFHYANQIENDGNVEKSFSILRSLRETDKKNSSYDGLLPTDLQEPLDYIENLSDVSRASEVYNALYNTNQKLNVLKQQVKAQRKQMNQQQQQMNQQQQQLNELRRSHAQQQQQMDNLFQLIQQRNII